MAIKEYIRQQKEYLIETRRYFHQNPELSLKEYRTAEKIEEELDKIGIQHSRVRKTGVIGILENISDESSAKTVVLRADIDALPIQELNDVTYKSKNKGVMHACGHDAHAASLLGAAKVLKEHERLLNGKVVLIFQQAEEIGGGARHFIRDGYLQNADRILGIHMASYLPTGTIAVKSGESNASCDYFKIVVTGKSAHVSKPHMGIDALYAASQIVVALQSIISKDMDPLESAVVGIGKMEAGTNYNIIANRAVLEGTTRTFNIAARKLVNEKVISIATQIAHSYGAIAEVEFKNYASPLVNDEEAAEEVAEVAKKIVSSENILRNLEKNLAADDFAEYLLKTKGQYVFIGSQKDEDTAFPHHHERFDIDENALLIAANLYVDYVIKVLRV
jgi:amidohydrolase